MSSKRQETPTQREGLSRSKAVEPVEAREGVPSPGKQEPSSPARALPDERQSHTSPILGRPALAFEVAGESYGLPIENVVQIVEMVNINRLPAVPEFIAGVVDYHGQVIPIVDLRRRFQLPPQDYTLRTPIIVSQLNGRTVGLIADGVSGMIRLQPGQIEPTNQIVADELLPQIRYISGIARLSDGLLLLLDPPTLFSREEEKAVAKASTRRRRSRKKKE